MENNQLPVLTLRAEHIMTNPKKLLGYVIMNEARDIVGVLKEEEVHATVLINAINSLTDDERFELFANYCRSCGSYRPNCHCWNDD